MFGCVSGNCREERFRACLQLGVQEGGRSLDNGDGLVVSSQSDELIIRSPQDHGEVQDKILGVHFCGELVGQIDLRLDFYQPLLGDNWFFT